jgi:NLR family CARD domain-containing protein 3
MVFSETILKMEDMVDKKTLQLSDLDLEFIATKAQTAANKLNPERALVRHNWLEVFIRLCQTKYMKNGAGGPEIKSWGDCLNAMLNNNVLPYFKQFDCHAWRKKHCWVEEIDLVLKHSLTYLKQIYQKNSGRFMAVGTNARYMSVTELTELLTDADIFNDEFG